MAQGTAVLIAPCISVTRIFVTRFLSLESCLNPNMGAFNLLGFLADVIVELFFSIDIGLKPTDGHWNQLTLAWNHFGTRLARLQCEQSVVANSCGSLSSLSSELRTMCRIQPHNIDSQQYGGSMRSPCLVTDQVTVLHFGHF